MLVSKEKKLISVLYYGIIEIRILASRKRESRRIFQLSNILHKIPKGIQEVGKFDFEKLRINLTEYQKRYKGDCIDFLKLLK